MSLAFKLANLQLPSQQFDLQTGHPEVAAGLNNGQELAKSFDYRRHLLNLLYMFCLNPFSKLNVVNFCLQTTKRQQILRIIQQFVNKIYHDVPFTSNISLHVGGVLCSNNP